MRVPSVGSLGAVAVCLLAGCSATPQPAASGDATPPPASQSGRSQQTSAATPSTPARLGYRMPLALAVNTTRTVADVSVRAAGRLVADGADDWSQIGQDKGPLRVIRAAGRTAERALRQVRSDRAVLAVVPATALDGTVRTLTVGGRHPLRHPQDYPLHTRVDRALPSVVTMTVVGDIMLARRVGRMI